MTMNQKTENTLPETNRYLIDVNDFAISGNEEISDIRLAARLEHKKDQTTDLLHTDINGERYILRIVGDIFIENGNGTMTSSDINNDDDFLLALERAENYEKDFIDAKLPYFEWITDDGEIAGGVFDSISTDPGVQIQKLSAYLAENDVARPGI